jgi:hypothetical protein
MGCLVHKLRWCRRVEKNKRKQIRCKNRKKENEKNAYSRCILFDGENISFDASLVMYINFTNIPPIMIINRIYETQNLLSV